MVMGSKNPLIQRVALLNRSGSLTKPLRYSEVRSALERLPLAEALAVLEGLEERARTVPDPEAYVLQSAKKRPPPVTSAGDDDGGIVAKRVRLLNATPGVLSRPIAYGRLRLGLNRVGTGRAMTLLQGLQDAGRKVNNPTAYIEAALKAAGVSLADGYDAVELDDADDEPEGDEDAALDDEEVGEADASFGVADVEEVEDMEEDEADDDELAAAAAMLDDQGDEADDDELAAAALALDGPALAEDEEPEEDAGKVERRVHWLNQNGGLQRPLRFDGDVSAALASLGTDPALRLLRSLESAASGTPDPRAFVMDQAKRRGSELWLREDLWDEDTVVARRVSWLNLFGGLRNPIRYDAVADVLDAVEVPHAMALLQRIETGARNIQDATGFVVQSLAGQGMEGPSRALAAATPTGRLVAQLNASGKLAKSIDFAEVGASLEKLGQTKAKTLLQEVELKGQSVKDPTGFLKFKLKALLAKVEQAEDKEDAPTRSFARAVGMPVPEDELDEEEDDDFEDVEVPDAAAPEEADEQPSDSGDVGLLAIFLGLVKRSAGKQRFDFKFADVAEALDKLGPRARPVVDEMKATGVGLSDPVRYLKQQAGLVRPDPKPVQPKPTAVEEVVDDDEAEAEPQEADDVDLAFGDDGYGVAEEPKINLFEKYGEKPAEEEDEDTDLFGSQRVIGGMRHLKKLTAAATTLRPVDIPVMGKETGADAEGAKPASTTRSAGLGTTPTEKLSQVRDFVEQAGLFLDHQALVALSRLPFYRSKDLVEEVLLGGFKRQGVKNPSRYITNGCQRLSHGLGVEQGIAMEMACSLGVVLNNDALDELASIPRKNAHAIIREMSKGGEDLAQDPIGFLRDEVLRIRSELDARPFPFKK